MGHYQAKKLLLEYIINAKVSRKFQRLVEFMK